MITPRSSVTEKGWTRGFTVAFLAMAAAVLFLALPACSPRPAIIDVKDNNGNPKKMIITYDRNMENVSATVDGKNIEVSNPQNFPIGLGEHTRNIVEIHHGPLIVFSGSPTRCILVGGKWIAYPPGTPCP